jgi:hypothetical protein
MPEKANMGPISVVLKAGLCYNKSRNRGEMTMTYTVQMGERQYHGLRGNLHIHTTSSDGAASHEEVGRIAAKAGLDFIVITDHNRFLPQHEGWIERTLVLVGEEVHDPNRKPQSSHLLCFQIREDVAPHAAGPQAVIDAVSAQGGFTFLAHPFERDAPEFLREPNISWRDWDVQNFTGIELWNQMSEFKSVTTGRFSALMNGLFPKQMSLGPLERTLTLWDEMIATRMQRIVAIGGVDAHQFRYILGPFSIVLYPYLHHFRSVITHILNPKPLSGSFPDDRNMIVQSLKQGHCFVAYDLPAPTDGFKFTVNNDDGQFIMGDEVEVKRGLTFQIRLPQRTLCRLLKDGKIIKEWPDRDVCTHLTTERGVYRVEAFMPYKGKLRGWIFSNPIYAWH